MTYTRYSVISGFMTGVGVIIILVQTLSFLGAPVASGGTIATLRDLSGVLDHFEVSAVAIAVATLAVALLWPRRYDRYLPSTLVALGVGTILGVFGSLTRRLSELCLPTCPPSSCLNCLPAQSGALLSLPWS